MGSVRDLPHGRASLFHALCFVSFLCYFCWIIFFFFLFFSSLCFLHFWVSKHKCCWFWICINQKVPAYKCWQLCFTVSFSVRRSEHLLVDVFQMRGVCVCLVWWRYAIMVVRDRLWRVSVFWRGNVGFSEINPRCVIWWNMQCVWMQVATGDLT